MTATILYCLLGTVIFIMKQFLIQYDTNYNSGKNLLMLVYADNYEDAVVILKQKVNTNSIYGSISIIKTTNLTIE